LLALQLPESHDNRWSRDFVIFWGYVVKLHLAVLMVVFCGCQKTQPSMEKAENDLHKAMNEARKESVSPSEAPTQETAESVKLKNTLNRAEFELRSELKQK